MDEVSLSQMREYLKQHVNDLSKEEKKGFLEILLNSMDESKIQTKGDGTQIRLNDIPDKVIKSVYAYTKNKLFDKHAALHQISDKTKV